MVTPEGWKTDTLGERLERTIECADFMAAIALVNQIAAVAEELNHHPDIDIRYNQVHFRLWTHTEHAITAKDIALAERISALL